MGSHGRFLLDASHPPQGGVLKIVFLLFLVSLLVFSPGASTLAQEKPIAALGRVSVLGEISKVQQNIIANRLRTILAESYNLVSQEQYQKAEQAAFESLDLDKCTEEECVRKIQELLQVDRLFILQILRDVDFTQLSLNLMKTDSTAVVDGVCKNCSTPQLYEKIAELTRQLVTQDIREGARELIAAQPVSPETPPQVEEEEGGIAWYWWVLGGLALVALAASSSSDDRPSPSEGSSPCPTAECGEVVVEL